MHFARSLPALNSFSRGINRGSLTYYSKMSEAGMSYIPYLSPPFTTTTTTHNHHHPSHLATTETILTQKKSSPKIPTRSGLRSQWHRKKHTPKTPFRRISHQIRLQRLTHNPKPTTRRTRRKRIQLHNKGLISRPSLRKRVHRTCSIRRELLRNLRISNQKCSKSI